MPRNTRPVRRVFFSGLSEDKIKQVRIAKSAAKLTAPARWGLPNMTDDHFLWRQLEHRCARSIFSALWVVRVPWCFVPMGLKSCRTGTKGPTPLLLYTSPTVSQSHGEPVPCAILNLRLTQIGTQWHWDTHIGTGTRWDWNTVELGHK